MKTIIYKGSEIVAGEFISNIPPTDIGRILPANYPPPRNKPVGRTAWRYLIPNDNDLLQSLLQRHYFLDRKYVEANYVVRGQEAPVLRRPIVKLRPLQLEWWIRNDGQQIDSLKGTTGVDIDALEAWAITKGSRNVAVAILDSGLDIGHPDLAPNVWNSQRAFRLDLGGATLNCGTGTHGINCLTPTTPFDVTDEHSHGTRLAGIVGAIHGGGGGATGVNNRVTQIPIKVLNWQLYGTIESVANGLDCAVQIAECGLTECMRLTVVLASWGFWSAAPSTLLQEKLDLLLKKNMLLVCAAHNCVPDANGNLDLQRDGTLNYYLPTFAHSNLLAVTGSDHCDQLIAGYGPKTIDIRAPGYAINSPTPDKGCSAANGASMAAAFAAGVAALVQSRCPQITAADLRNCLIAGASATASQPGSTVGGRLNALGALQHSPCAASWILDPVPAEPMPPDILAQPQIITGSIEPIVPWEVEWELEQTSDEYQDRPNQKQKQGAAGDGVRLEKVGNKYYCRFWDKTALNSTFKGCSALPFELIEKVGADGKTVWKQMDFTTAEKSTVEYGKLATAIMSDNYSYYKAEGAVSMKDPTVTAQVLALFVPIVVLKAGEYFTHFALVLVNQNEPWPPHKPLGMQGGVLHGSGNNG